MVVNVPGAPQDALVPFQYITIDPSQRRWRYAPISHANDRPAPRRRHRSRRSPDSCRRCRKRAVAIRRRFHVGGDVPRRSAGTIGTASYGPCRLTMPQAPRRERQRLLRVSAAATGAGTISLYIAGRRIAVGITGATATAAIATAINTAIIANAGGGANGVLAGIVRSLRSGGHAHQPQRRRVQRHRRAPFLSV